ncbi:unnamed protein product [Paramecium octaurelia]|uniref:Transmembrane protein n=1 Tax=Paramecium octaurelia TaxID=43137 RepID=A0A8S1U6W8_PAROT|nr:unnamed protein product [Paramecium octaurelia]
MLNLYQIIEYFISLFQIINLIFIILENELYTGLVTLILRLCIWCLSTTFLLLRYTPVLLNYNKTIKSGFIMLFTTLSNSMIEHIGSEIIIILQNFRLILIQSFFLLPLQRLIIMTFKGQILHYINLLRLKVLKLTRPILNNQIIKDLINPEFNLLTFESSIQQVSTRTYYQTSDFFDFLKPKRKERTLA